GLIYHALGDYSSAADFFTRNVECIEGDLLHERFGAPHFLAATSRAWLARILGERGEFQQGIALGQQAVQLANAIDHPFTSILAYRVLGELHIQKGEPEQAVLLVEHAVRLCEQWQIRNLFAPAATWLGNAYVLSNRVAEALPLVERAMEQSATISLVSGRALWGAWLAVTHLAAGRIHEAA